MKEGSKPGIHQGKSFPGREEAVQKTVQRREHLGIFKEKQRDNEAGLSKEGVVGEMKRRGKQGPEHQGLCLPTAPTPSLKGSY